MSKDNITRRISIFVNGKEVENSLKGVEGAMAQVRNRLRALNTDSATYDQDSKELSKTMVDLRQRQSDYREELGLTNKTMQEAGEVAGGLRGTLSGIWDSLVSGDLQGAKEGLSQLGAGFSGLVKSSLAFIATPIGAAIAVLAGIAAGAKAMFDFNVNAEKGAQLIENLSGKTGQVVEDIRIKIQALTDTFGVGFDELAGAVDNLVDTELAKDELEALEKIKNGLLTAPDKNEFISSLESSAVVAKQVGLNLEEVIGLKKAIEETGVNPEATFGALSKATNNLKLQTDELREKLASAFGASFSDEVLAKVKTGQITTVQALDLINTKSKQVGLNQTQQAKLGKELFGKSAIAAGGFATVLDTVSAGLKKQNQELNGNQKALKELADANEQLEKGMSGLFRVSNFGALWDSLKAKVIGYFATWLTHLTFIKNALLAFGNITQNTFINVKNTILSVFQGLIERISPALKVLGVDVDSLKKKLEGFKSKNVKFEIENISSEEQKKPKVEVTKLTKEELDALQALRDEARRKEADKRAQEEAKKKAEREKAAKEEYDRVKALADAKANLAKAKLDQYIADLRSNIDKEKALTPESIATETDRLQKIKDKQIEFNNAELARKITDLEAKGVLEKTSQEVLNAQKEALTIENELKNQELQLGFQQSTDALKKQYIQEQKVLEAEQLLLDNELALAEATTKEEASKIKQEQDYKTELDRYDKLYADKKITEDEFDRFRIEAREKQAELNKQRDIQQLNGTLGGLNSIAGAVGELFGQSKELAIVQAGINGAMAITSILAQYPKFDGGFAMTAAIVAAGITTVAQISKIASSKPPKKPKIDKGFFYGGDTGSKPALGYDQYGPVTGYVHKNEYVIPEVMTQDPTFANTIGWLEANRQQKLRGFVDGGSTSGSVSFNTATTTQNNYTQRLMEAVLFRLENPVKPNLELLFGYEQAQKVQDLNNEISNSNANGTIQ